MTKPISTEELDRLLAALIQSADGISDLLFVAGKPPQVEVHGRLKPFALEPPESIFTSARIEGLARAIINNNARAPIDVYVYVLVDVHVFVYVLVYVCVTVYV